MADDTDEIALFPLSTVLFPGGGLPLRIFEARYVDMVGDCMRRKRPFGVVPISDGREVGAIPLFHAYGTLAHIETWDQGNDGLLNLLARGRERFRVNEHRVRPDGLVLGQIQLEAETADDIAPVYTHLSRLLNDVLTSRPELAPPPPWHLDSAAWVAYRVAEFMPLNLNARLEILRLATGAAKLALVASLVEAQSTRPPDTPKH